MASWAIHGEDRKVLRIEDSESYPAELGDLQATAVVISGSPWAGKPKGNYELKVALSGYGMVWEYEGSFSELQELKWEEMKAARSVAETSPITWDGSVFDGDAISRTRLCDAAMLASFAVAAGVPYEVEWTLADNTTRLLSATDLMSIVVQGGTDVGVAFATARALREQIDLATTAEELQAINWPT